MPKLTVNGVEVEVAPGSTVLQACEAAGVEIPRFCYHERLSIAGNCRMCLVEMEKSPKPIASCAMPAGDGMVIRTNTPQVKKAREGVMEFLLINHPLDCPICDQGGECDLQDEAMGYGRGGSRYHEHKRAVSEKYMGPLIKTTMTRCIHCTRCVRFAEEVAGVEEIGALYRGENMQITSYLERALTSELSANVIDLCPVGALTSKPYAFTARAWELKKTEAIDVMDAVGSNIRIDARGNEVMRVLPRLHEDINEEWISDKSRFACDGLAKRRLDRPYVKRDGKLVEASWAEAFAAIKQAVAAAKPDRIAALAGDLHDVEAMFALKELMAALGVTRTECRTDGAKLDPQVRAGYLFNSGIAGIEDADLLLLVGVDLRRDAPIVASRVRKAVRHKRLVVATIGPVRDLAHPVEQLGDDAGILAAIASGKHPLAARLKAAKKPAIIVGMAALARPDGAAILDAARAVAENSAMVRDDWNGFNVLHDAAARVGALDIGLVSDGGMAGLVAEAEKIELLYLLGADEVALSPFKNAFVVYQGSHGDRGAHRADVILPGAAYTEKSGTYVNMEGRVQQSPRAIFPPGDAREDWAIIRALSDVLGKTLGYDDLHQLRAALAARHPGFAEIDGKPVAAWGEFGASGEIAASPIFPTGGNFYQSNPIARSSDTMAACVREILGEGREATGTHG